MGKALWLLKERWSKDLPWIKALIKEKGIYEAGTWQVYDDRVTYAAEVYEGFSMASGEGEELMLKFEFERFGLYGPLNEKVGRRHETIGHKIARKVVVETFAKKLKEEENGI